MGNRKGGGRGGWGRRGEMCLLALLGPEIMAVVVVRRDTGNFGCRLSWDIAVLRLIMPRCYSTLSSLLRELSCHAHLIN